MGTANSSEGGGGYERPRFPVAGERWFRPLFAVLLGNLLYYSLAEYLPEGARHKVNQIDAGLFVDFLICAAVYGMTFAVWKGRPN